MTQATDDRLDPRLVRLILVVLLGGIMGVLDGTVVAVGIDTLATDLGTSLAMISWVSTGYLLALTATIPVTGWAVDRFGGKRLWIFGLVFFLAASLASALAPNVGLLIFFRVLQGVAAGVLDPLVLTLLARAAGPRYAGRVMGMMGVVLASGPVLGLILGGVILNYLDWRWMFLINLPIGIVALVLALRVLPRDEVSNEQARSKLDVTGLALIAPASLALILAMTQAAENRAFADWNVLVPLVAGLVLLVAYTVQALRPRSVPPVIDPRLFANRGFTASVVTMMLVGLASFASLFALPLYYQQMNGHGALAAGLLVAPFGVGGATAMPIAGRLSDKIGARALVRGGASVAMLAALSLTWVGADSTEIWPALAAFAIGAGLGCVGAPTMGSLYRTLPGAQVPQGSSVLYILNQVGAAIGIAAVALIMETVGGEPIGGFHGVYWFAVVATVLILFVSTLLPGRPDAPAPSNERVEAGATSTPAE